MRDRFGHEAISTLPVLNHLIVQRVEIPQVRNDAGHHRSRGVELATFVSVAGAPNELYYATNMAHAASFSDCALTWPTAEMVAARFKKGSQVLFGKGFTGDDAGNSLTHTLELPAMPHALDHCLLKIERAKNHRDSLQQYISETYSVESTRPRLGIKLQADRGEHVLFVNRIPPVGDFLSRASIVASDSIHNLRSCLNHLVFQLAVNHTGNAVLRPKKIDFPTKATTTDFSELTSSDKIQGSLTEVAPAHQAILESFQPYRAFSVQPSIFPDFHPIERLHELWNMDKHQLPIKLTVSVGGMENFTPEAMLLFTASLFGMGTKFRPAGTVDLALHAEVAAISGLPASFGGGQLEMAGYAAPTVAFDNGAPLVTSLDRMIVAVRHIVDQFIPLL